MTKITKSKARLLYLNRKQFYICASKLRPEYALQIDVDFKNDADYPTFENLLNAFRYYNCSRETGMGISFYVD